jgi:dienelactone hydrolase
MALAWLVVACDGEGVRWKADAQVSLPEPMDAGGEGAPQDGGAMLAPDDVAEKGPYQIYKKDRDVKGTKVTVFAPSDGAAGIAAGKHPLVIVSPGFQVTRDKYADKTAHLASWGFVAISQSFGGGLMADHMAYAKQTSAIIDWALSDTSGLADVVDGDKIGVAGHSMGGKISMLAAALDARIGAVVGWDPVDSNWPGSGSAVSVTPELMSRVKAKVAVLGETLDAAGSPACAPASDNFHQYYLHASSPALEVTVVGADHMDWVEGDGGLAGMFCRKGQADGAYVQMLTKRTTTAWLRRQLMNDVGMDTFLDGDTIAGEMAANKVHVVVK